MYPGITATLIADHGAELRREAADQRLAATARKHRSRRSLLHSPLRHS